LSREDYSTTKKKGVSSQIAFINPKRPDTVWQAGEKNKSSKGRKKPKGEEGKIKLITHWYIDCGGSGQ